MTSEAFERLATALEGAKQVPLTGQIRIDSGELIGLLDQARVEMPLATPALGRLEALIEAGRPIPLSAEVRIDRRAVLSTLKEARRAEKMPEERVSGESWRRLIKLKG